MLYDNAIFKNMIDLISFGIMAGIALGFLFKAFRR